MWFSRKYGERGVLRRVQSSAIWLDNDSYVRNALAYVPRNAIDNGCNVDEYRWSGYSAMFRKQAERGRRVAILSSRETERILHTGMDLKDVGWMVDDEDCLVPGSICDREYLEQAFEGSQAYFLKMIGSLNAAEMDHRLVDAPRTRVLDVELQKDAEELSRKWFGTGLAELSQERKLRLFPYLFRTRRTSSPQLARVLGLRREVAERAVDRLKGR